MNLCSFESPIESTASFAHELPPAFLKHSLDDGNYVVARRFFSLSPRFADEGNNVQHFRHLYL